MAVTVTDNSLQIKGKMSTAVRRVLYEVGSEVAAHANSNVKMKDDAGQKLRGSYRVERTDYNKVEIGTALEEGLWEEFGTGSHADTVKNGGIPGRPMWWVYVTNETPRTDNPVYRTEEEAKGMAAGLREQGKDAHASNGNDPNYTLEKAFLAKKEAGKREIENAVRMGVE